MQPCHPPGLAGVFLVGTSGSFPKNREMKGLPILPQSQAGPAKSGEAPPAPAPQAMERESRPAPQPMFSDPAAAKEWAAEWWAGYKDKVKADNFNLYTQKENLLAQLDRGPDGGIEAVKLLRLSWLEKRAAMVEAAPDEAARRDLALPRRQELEARHPEAFLSADEMRALPHGYGEADTLRLIAISHGWVRSSLESHAQAAPIPDAADPLAPQLTPEHPDPRA